MKQTDFKRRIKRKR